MKTGISAQMLVKNEENWVWFAIQSVLPVVDRFMIFDTGSTDRTAEIINSVKSPKLILKHKPVQSRDELVAIRNEMLRETLTPWFLLVDGDEVWPAPALSKLTSAISKAPQTTWGMVVRTRNCVGDVWHYQPEEAGRYILLGKKGHLTIRAYRKLPGFHWEGVYPNEAYSDPRGKPINEESDHLQFVDVAYWHLTHLSRTSAEEKIFGFRSRKIEKGIRVDDPKALPEVFFRNRPLGVHDPLSDRGFFYTLLAFFLTPLLAFKRRMDG